MKTPAKVAWLVPLSGPALASIELTGSTSGFTVGRQAQCQVQLSADTVSRTHARFECESGRWFITDLKSRWGTFLNGQRIAPDERIPLQQGDLIGISPWTFNFNSEASNRRGVASMNDLERNQTLVRAVLPHRAGMVSNDRLALLLEVTAAMQSLANEEQLAQVLLDAASRGSDLHNAAILRPVDADGGVEILAARKTNGDQPLYSRSLINAASGGVVSAFFPDNEESASHSIISLKIDAALCVPLMLGTTVAGYLYLDARGGTVAISAQQWAATSAFCLALGRIASLALANLKRLDVERRAALMEAELQQAVEVQRWVLPRRDFVSGTFHCTGESRPGRGLGGDFFDLFPLDDGRLAIMIGDVSGKGTPASVLMTSANGFLHSALQQHGNPQLAVTQLSAFLTPRQPGDRFLTLWVGVLDPSTLALNYVDAGHGYALLWQPGNAPLQLSAGENLPIGLTQSHTYASTSVQLDKQGVLLVVSDGIVEQSTPPTDESDRRVQFGLDRLREMSQRMGEGAINLTHLFDAVFSHAAAPILADDATAVLLRWS